MTDWWSDTDSSILDFLREAGPVAPADVGRRLGISEGEATTFLCLLAAEGKVRIRLAELSDEPAGPSTNGGAEFAGMEAALPWDDGCAAIPVGARAGARRQTRRSRGR